MEEKKDEKKKKGAAKGKEEDKKPKRKGPPAAALKAMLEAQAAEEEARKQAEEEQRKKEVQLDSTTTSRILRTLMEHIEMKNSLDSKLQIMSICSIRISSRNQEKIQNKTPCLVTTLINFLFFATFLVAQIIVLALIIDKGFRRADKGFSIDA